MKLIITGATSMIGTALIQASLKRGDEIFAIIRPDTQRIERIPKSEHVYLLKKEIDQLVEMDGLPNDCDVLYHLAWIGTSKGERDDPVQHEKNIKYTLDAVTLASKTGCKKFVGAGSQAEYGLLDGRITAETKFSPTTAYGIAKYASGILSRNLCEKKGIKHVWARIFSVYGPHDNDGTMINSAIDQFIRGEKVQFSAAQQMWNYLYESDAGEMLYELGSSDNLSGEFFVANNYSMPLRKYIEKMITVFQSPVMYSFDKEGGGSLYDLDVDMSETEKAIKYRPKVDFEEGIRHTIQYRRSMNATNFDN